jgi:hypothetical protein
LLRARFSPCNMASAKARDRIHICEWVTRRISTNAVEI